MLLSLRSLAIASLCTSAGLAQDHTNKIWKEKELRPYVDVDEPPNSILLALKRTVYNVTESPRFYGPGGPYHHFTGRDASRAWVTECWDDEDQLTWRMDGVEDMFMPQYLDELMDDLASGKEVAGMQDMDELGLGREQMVQVAKMSIDKTGGVSKKKRAKRREEDLPEAREKVEAVLKHWKSFFESKYPVVGTVEHDEEGTPAPPPLCEKAMKKRSVKGGKLEGLMKGMGGMTEDAKAEGMPDLVKERLEQKELASEAGGKDEL